MIFGVILTLQVFAQTNSDEQKIPKQPSPTNLANYKMAIDFTNKDLNGSILVHKIIKGKIIQLSQKSPVDNTYQLEDVSLTEISEQGKNTRKLDELERLKIEILGDNFTNSDFYKDYPPAHVEVIRWFVQDKVGLDIYGQMYLDSLRLNIPFYPDFFQNQQADFEQYVNFNTQKLNITWLGFSEINKKNCILVYFKSMYNPIDADNDMMTLNGRSCFWGNIWILPDTRHIEYAIMNEDLVYKMKLKVNDFEQQVNMQREVIYEKIE